jgi:hypothetical protein
MERLPCSGARLPRMNPDDLQRALLDPTAPIPHGWPAGWQGVLLLFLVPIGGGIPAGVLLARDRGLAPLVMMFLYFVSDLVLACVFEPIMKALFAVVRRVPPLHRFGRAMIARLHRPGSVASTVKGPLGLVLVAFTVDPMTGRAAAHAAGHGFVSGWAIAIAGDMVYFTVLMISTLWLNGIVGDEASTVGIMLLVMLALPQLTRRWTERRAGLAGAPERRA